MWPADQSQLTWPQYSSSGPIRGEYCDQLTNHSSPGQQRHVVRDLGQLVRAQVQLHHVTPGPIRGEHYSCPPIRDDFYGHVTTNHDSPCPDVDGKRGQLILLHVQLLQMLCPGENAVRDSKDKYSTSNDCCCHCIIQDDVTNLSQRLCSMLRLIILTN